MNYIRKSDKIVLTQARGQRTLAFSSEPLLDARERHARTAGR